MASTLCISFFVIILGIVALFAVFGAIVSIFDMIIEMIDDIRFRKGKIKKD